MEIFGAISFFIMGFTLGLIGGGGSILTVPILVYIFNQNPLIATANSLFIVGATAAIGGLQYFAKKQVDIKTVVLFSIPSFLGVYTVRKIILPLVPEVVFTSSSVNITKSFLVMFMFAVIMLVAALKMIKPSQIATSEKNLRNFSAKVIGTIIFQGLMVGAVAGFVGAGGGFLIIPALTLLLNLPMRMAVGSSLLIIAIQSLLGYLFSSTLALVDWPFLLTQVAIAASGILFGVYLSRFTPEKMLKTGFGYFVLIVSLLIMVEQLITQIIETGRL